MAGIFRGLDPTRAAGLSLLVALLLSSTRYGILNIRNFDLSVCFRLGSFQSGLPVLVPRSMATHDAAIWNDENAQVQNELVSFY
jgi:hypothetical protein